MKSIQRFSKDSQLVWPSKANDGKVSGAIQTEHLTVGETGFIQNEKLIFWLKANNAEQLEMGIAMIEAQLKSGARVLYKVYSEEPFYASQESDINPSTGESLGRYSETRIGSPTDALAKHKQYVSLQGNIIVAKPSESENIFA